MRSDSQIAFVPIGGNLSMVAGAGIAIPSSNTLDLLGAGVGVAPPSIIGNLTNFGTDFGIDPRKQNIAIFLGATPAFAGAGGTLNIALQMAPDTGAAGNYQPGTWQTVGETGVMTLAQLIAAQTGALQQPIRLDWPPNFPMNLSPRFARLLFTPAAASPFTNGVIAAALVVPVRDDFANRFAARNYAVA